MDVFCEHLCRADWRPAMFQLSKSSKFHQIFMKLCHNA